MGDALIYCDSLFKIYQVADLEVIALQGLELTVTAGEMVAIVGASGSGKSTLLNILGGLDEPSAGDCVVAGYDLRKLSEQQRINYRRSVVGHVWQQSGRNLITECTVATNIDLPQIALDVNTRARKERTTELLDLVGLSEKANRFPTELSGGEQQRAGIAVALANAPALLLADEPTGELDSVTAEQVLVTLREFNRRFGQTIVLVTHDQAVAAAMDRTIAISDGRTSTETVRRDEETAHSATPMRASAIIGLPGETHREYIVLDKTGRLKVPQDMLDDLGIAGRAEIRKVGDHLEIWPV